MLEVTIPKRMIQSLDDDVVLKIEAYHTRNYFPPMTAAQSDHKRLLYTFETQPLIPGVPHVYDIRFTYVRRKLIRERTRYGREIERWEETPLKEAGVLRVRLIHGRIVRLDVAMPPQARPLN